MPKRKFELIQGGNKPKPRHAQIAKKVATGPSGPGNNLLKALETAAGAPRQELGEYSVARTAKLVSQAMKKHEAEETVESIPKPRKVAKDYSVASTHPKPAPAAKKFGAGDVLAKNEARIIADIHGGDVQAYRDEKAASMKASRKSAQEKRALKRDLDRQTGGGGGGGGGGRGSGGGGGGKAQKRVPAGGPKGGQFA